MHWARDAPAANLTSPFLFVAEELLLAPRHEKKRRGKICGRGVGAHSKALRKKFCRANALAAAVRPLANAVRPLARPVRPIARAVRGLAARGEKFVGGAARGRILYVSCPTTLHDDLLNHG